MSRRLALFEAIRPFAPKRQFSSVMVDAINALADMLGIPDDTDAGPSEMQLSDHGLAHIKASEGLRLKAYPDPGSGGDPWTIGYGHTGKDVTRGLVINEATADQLLRHDVERFEAAVRKLAPKTTQGQFDALVSFAFNVGEGNLAKSTLLRLHNAGDYAGAANEFAKWTLAAGRRLPGLVTRRAGEAKLYRGGA